MYPTAHQAVMLASELQATKTAGCCCCCILAAMRRAMTCWVASAAQMSDCDTSVTNGARACSLMAQQHRSLQISWPRLKHSRTFERLQITAQRAVLMRDSEFTRNPPPVVVQKPKT